MAMFHDDSTDDVTCYLQLEERLRINRGEQASSSRNTMSGKDMKQFCNRQRQKHILDEQSSSSSSLDMHNDPSIPGPSSAYFLQNKKRQNGDKPIDRLVNSKRTCLGEDFQISPGFFRKTKTNGDIAQSKSMNNSAEPSSLFARSLLPGKTYEDHINDLSDAEDSDSEPCLRPSNRNKKPLLNNGVPKHPGLFETLPPGSRGVQFVDSTSEDDCRPVQIGSLKGGRQSPDPTTNRKVIGRKIKRVLDSDDSDSGEWQVGYRARPLMFSSSDSDDSKPGKRSNEKSSDNLPKKSANHSFSPGELQKSGQDHSGFRGKATKNICSSIDIPPVPTRSCPIRSPLRKSYKTRGSSRMNGQTAHMFGTIGESLTIPENQLMQPHQRTLRSTQPADVDLISRQKTKLNNEVLLGDFIVDRDVASSSGVPTQFVPSLPHPNPAGHSEVPSPPKLARGSSSRKLPDTSKLSRRRGLGRSRTSKDKHGLTANLRDFFDADDSSEVEFFTANSYSDNESNTESLNRRMGPLHGRPVPKPEMRSDPSINVGSSEDEISVVFSSGPSARCPRSRTSESRRGISRTLGRRYSRGSRRHLSHTQDVSLSPDPVEQVRQVEEDEGFARILQAQFDAEVDPTFTPRPQGSPNPCMMNIREATSSDDDTSSIDIEDVDFRHRQRHPFPIQQFQFAPPTPPHFALLNPVSLPPRFDLRINLDTITSGRHRARLPDLYNLHPWHARNETSFGNMFPFEDESYETFLGLVEMNGDVTRGLQKSQINRLPTRKFTTISSASSSSAVELPHKRAELNKECQVCLNDYVNGDVLRILPCFHEFHTPCIDPWLKINHTCPVCRVVVDLEE